MSAQNVPPASAERTSAHWENYWAGSSDDGRDAAVTGASRSATFQDAWKAFFQALEEESTSAGFRLADLACGAGVVSEIAAKVLTPQGLAQASFLGLDYSFSATRQYRARFGKMAIGSASGVLGDAFNIPLKPQSIDAVTSQFGLEYAGADALALAGRLTAPGGRIMCLVHYKNGGIEKECQNNLAAAEVILSSKALAKTRAHFVDPNNAVTLLEMRAAMDKLRKAMDSLSESAGKTHVGKLRLDLTRLIARRAAYDPKEIVAWFDDNEIEVSLYADRMRSMTRAALDKKSVEHICQQWTSEGLETAAPQAIELPGAAAPSAWKLFAQRATG